MKISFAYPDPTLPRTVYYERLCEVLRNHPDFVERPEDADLLFPLEDTALETNWPRYRRPDTALVRGSSNYAAHLRYLESLVTTQQRLAIINMHPSLRVPTLLAANPKIIVADVNLRSWERSVNPRTISMPALPLTVGQFNPAAKRLAASFRGAASHPTRDALVRLHNGTTYICELIDVTNHAGKIDAERNSVDRDYADLLSQSVFAFVPRGDSEFSYRLLEVLSFGCIPIVLADGLVLPFDRIVDWYAIALHVPEKDIPQIPAMLENIRADRIHAMQLAAVQTYAAFFSSLDAVVRSLLAEIELLVRGGW